MRQSQPALHLTVPTPFLLQGQNASVLESKVINTLHRKCCSSPWSKYMTSVEEVARLFMTRCLHVITPSEWSCRKKKMHISPQTVVAQIRYGFISYHWHQGYQQRPLKLPEDTISSNANKPVHPQTSLLVAWSPAAGSCQGTIITSQHCPATLGAFNVDQHLVIPFKYPSRLDPLCCSCSPVASGP